ncbi:MAG TPA: thioredoxin family protein [Stellaceae bacterium]|nr:thioredoxin family protein [Stellaceae bacterium]
MTQSHSVVSHDQWIEARKALLAKEKEFSRLRDELSRQRRALPWERVEKEYVFNGSAGRETLAQLFAGKSQLIIYHFMFDPEWEVGCKSCSFWADNFNGIDVHLWQRDISFLAVSRAPLAKLEAYKGRMGWTFKWVSSFGTDFNFDYGVSHTKEEVAKGQAYWNYKVQKPYDTETVGISVFAKNPDSRIFHTYSTYQRGVDLLNGAYNYIDLTPKGRDESGQGPNPQAWVRRHDEYEDLPGRPA